MPGTQFTMCFEWALILERLLVSRILDQLFCIYFLLTETIAWCQEKETK